MIVTTRLPRALAEDNELVQYGFGTLFGLAIIGLDPYLLARRGSPACRSKTLSLRR